MDRRSAIKHVVGALGAAKLWDADAFAAHQSAAGSFRIETPRITAYLNKQGVITGLVLAAGAGKQLASAVTGGTTLLGCTVGQVKSRRLAGGGVEFTKTLTHAVAGESCQLTERFLPAPSGSIRWEIEILGDGGPWSTSIETHLSWPASAATRFWTTWGDSRPEGSKGWNDPLIPASFASARSTTVRATLKRVRASVSPSLPCLKPRMTWA